MSGAAPIYSIVIPAHNEEDSIRPVLRALAEALASDGIAYEIVVVNDHSRDRTREAVEEVAREFPAVRCVDNEGPGGFGLAVRAGLDAFAGDIVAVVMADGSDPPAHVAEAALRFMLDRLRPAELPAKFDLSLARRRLPHADREIPGLIR